MTVRFRNSFVPETAVAMGDTSPVCCLEIRWEHCATVKTVLPPNAVRSTRVPTLKTTGSSWTWDLTS